MGAQANAAPVIIKRKKVVGGDGHHGGAWKVAYADFVTAMMAFFMLMWLLNATTEQQRKGIADYFSPTIPINRVSGGGNGAFQGDSIFSEETLARNGTGATAQRPSEENQARGDTGTDSNAAARAQEEAQLQSLMEELLGRGGESEVMENQLKHIVTRITDEGLVIELFDLPDVPLFEAATTEPTPLMRELAGLVARLAGSVTNDVAVAGHVRANPVVQADNPVWDLSAGRADSLRALLKDNGLRADRVQRVTGHADRDPVTRDPMAQRNNRVEIILLRAQ
ncbi:MAG: flagellar motor protein MotB [Pseudomonadota bacterium]